MTYLRLFLSCGTIFIIVMASSIDENTKNESNIAVKSCFPDYIRPEKSDIILIPYINIDDYHVGAYNIQFERLTKEQQFRSNFFHGESNTVINIIHPIANISLNLWKLRITRMWVQVVKRVLGKEEIQDLWPSSDPKSNSLFLFFEHDLMPGSYVLKMKYFGTIPNNMKTFIVISYLDEGGNVRSLIMGNLKKIRNQNVFPCPYETRLMVNLTISIKHREAYRILSNVPSKVRHMKVRYDDGMIWTHFDISKMTTNFVAIPTLDYDCFYLFSEIKMWCRRHMMKYMSFAGKTAINITTYMQYELHNSVNRIFKMDQLFVIIPGFQEENIALNMILGLTVYREADLFYEKSDHSARKMEVRRLVMRKIINQWFGNVQTSINAGLALFLEAYVIDKVFENSRMMDLFVVQNQHESLHLLSYFNMNPFQTQVSFIIRTLQHLITDEVFWRRICKCINEYVLNSTNLDFSTVMQTELNDSHKFSNFTSIVSSWTMPRHCPILTIYHGYDKIVMRVQNFSGNWLLPVTFTSQSKPDFSITSFRNIIWLEQTARIPLNALSMDLKYDDWIIVNLQQVGQYRVNYDIQNWRKIAKYLNSRNYSNIHVLNRAQIIDDAFYFATEKKLNISIFWSLASYLSRDTDYIAWYPMIKALEYMSTIFPLPDERVENIKNKISKILEDVLQLIGYIEKSKDDDFTKYLKQELAKWACTLGQFCYVEARSCLRWHLEDIDKHKVLPWWKEWTYCKGLVLEDSTTWNEVMDMWKKKRDNKILEYLSCSQNMTIIENLLIRTEIKLQDDEDAYNFHSIIAKHARNDFMLEIIILFFFEIKPRQISTAAALIDTINHVYSKQQLDKVLELTPYMEEQYRDYFNKKIEIRLSQITNQMDYLHIVSRIEENDLSY